MKHFPPECASKNVILMRHMATSIPCKRTIFLTNFSATRLAVNGCFSGIIMTELTYSIRHNHNAIEPMGQG